jgi:hypothetical protein
MRSLSHKVSRGSPVSAVSSADFVDGLEGRWAEDSGCFDGERLEVVVFGEGAILVPLPLLRLPGRRCWCHGRGDDVGGGEGVDTSRVPHQAFGRSCRGRW